MVHYDDDDNYDDYDDYVPKMKMSGMAKMLNCTPLKIYLGVALISLVCYYGNNLLKGKIDFSNCSSIMCTILCFALVIMFTCKANYMISWILAIVLSMCAICFAMGQLPIPKIF